jgi:adenosylhomocysteine nucleosidase
MKKLFVVILIFGHSLSVSAQRIAVMGALDQEITILLDSMQGKKKVQRGGIDFYK